VSSPRGTPDFPDKPLSAKAQRRLALATARRYRLQGDEGVAEDVRRVARGRTESAAEHLRAESELGSAIHETRKDIKKLRSLLRLVREGSATTSIAPRTSATATPRGCSRVRVMQR
jgi:hypothetical protein